MRGKLEQCEYEPPKQHANLKFLECKSARKNSKRAVRAGIERKNI